MDKLAEIWDQLTLNQRSCPVDRNGRHENPSDVEFVVRGGPHALRRRRLMVKADELRNQNRAFAKPLKCTPTPPNAASEPADSRV